MQRILFALLAGLLLLQPLTAQETTGFCGTSRETLNGIAERLKGHLAELKADPAAYRSGAVTYVPIKFHIVNKNDGSGGVEVYKVLDMLCGLNAFYENMDIQFYMKGGINTFNSSIAYDDPRSDAGSMVLAAKRFKAYMNVFLTNQTGEANVLGYYTNDGPAYNIDGIIVRRDQIKSGAETIEHEAGHYFSLLHPFNGWECEPWDAGTHGNPVALPGNLAPCNSLKPPYNDVLIEYVDGSNASTAGDYLSDTPADYNVGLGWPNCSYAGGAKDPKGVLLNPDEENIMGYFSFCTNYHFSDQQKSVVAASLTERRNLPTNNNRYINCNSTPELGAPGPSAAYFPQNMGYSNGIDNVKLEWTAGPGAQSYVIRIDRLTSFGFMPHYYYTTEPEVTLDFTLSDGKIYYWQVWPYNEYNTCENWGTTFQFTAGMSSSVNRLEGLSALQVLQNPVPAGQPVTLQVAVDRDVAVEIQILDLAGRPVTALRPYHFQPGIQVLSIDEGLPTAGMYFLRIRNAQGVMTERLIGY